MSMEILNVNDSAVRTKIERSFMRAEYEAGKLKTSPKSSAPLYHALFLLRWVVTQGKAIREKGAILHKRKAAIIRTLDFRNPPALRVESGENARNYHSGEHIPFKISGELSTEFLAYADELRQVSEAETLYRQYVHAFDRIRERILCSAEPLNSESADILSILRVSIPGHEWQGRKVTEHHEDKIHSRLVQYLTSRIAVECKSVIPLFGLSADKRTRTKKGKTGRVSVKRGEAIVNQLPTTVYQTGSLDSVSRRIDRLQGMEWRRFMFWYCQTVKRSGDNSLDRRQAFALRSFLFGEHTGLNPEHWTAKFCPDVFEFLETYPRPLFKTQERDNAFLVKLSALNKLASGAYYTMNGIDRAIRVSRVFFPVNPDYTRTEPGYGNPLFVTLRKEDFGSVWPVALGDSLLIPVVACQNLVLSGTRTVTVKGDNGQDIRRTVATTDRWVTQTEFGFQRTGFKAIDEVLKRVYSFHSELPVLNERINFPSGEFEVRGNLSIELSRVIVATLSQRVQDRAKRAEETELSEKKLRKDRAEKLRLLRSLDSVTIEDSLRSGNCQAGTEQFVRNVLRLPHGVNSVSGRELAKLWKNANYLDHYLFFRCIERAAERQKEERGVVA